MNDHPPDSDAIDPTIALALLIKIEEDSAITQRSLASELGIALGLANTYLKRCVKKGLVKINQVPANRYAYFLTPQGFAEKSRLTSQYLSQGFQFFRMSRHDVEAVFALCGSRKYTQVALHGLTDLAEIAVLCSREANIDIVAIVDPNTAVRHFAGIPIVPDVADVAGAQAIILTDLGNPQDAYDQLRSQNSGIPILVPALLKVRTAEDTSRVTER